MAQPFLSEVAPTAERVADWVEFRALQQRTAFKRGDLRSALLIDTVDSPDLVELRTWEVLGQRSALFGNRWPLRLDGNRLTRRANVVSGANLTYYKYLLLLGMGEVDKEDRQLFEVLVGQALMHFSGRQSLRLGAPALPGASASFRVRVDEYATNAAMLIDLEYNSKPLPSDQDFGLDVVTWLPFSDPRSGSLHFIAQCATGADWVDKLDELHVESWSPHINWAVRPVRVFGVPFAITLIPVKWFRVCKRAGLVLDRPRLLELHMRKPLDTKIAVQVRDRVNALTV